MDHFWDYEKVLMTRLREKNNKKRLIMTKTKSHYHYILLDVSDPKPSEPTKGIQYCMFFFHYEGVYQSTRIEAIVVGLNS